MRTKMLILVLLALSLLAGMARAAPPPGLEIIRHVIGGGGGRVEQSPYVLNFTVGQAVAGPASQTPYQLCAGYWCGVGAEQGEDLPALSIAKSGPSEAEAGEPIAYTIVVTNTGSALASSVVITDVLPLGAAFIAASDGGEQVDGTVSWSVDNLSAVSSLTRSFTVSATETITNDNYTVSCAEGVSGVGSVAVVTEIGGEPADHEIFLPLVVR